MAYALTENPILARALRKRWRTKGAFLGLLLLVAVPGLVAVWIYASAFQEYSLDHWRNSSAQQVRAGITVLQYLSLMAIAAIILSAPRIAAGTVARDRESGILESMQLSALSPLQIIGGNYLAALASSTLGAITLFPVVSILLLLGGISLIDLGGVLVSIGVCGAFCTLVAVCVSSWCPRAQQAQRATTSLLTGWLISSFAAESLARAIPPPTNTGWLTNLRDVVIGLAEYYSYSNPLTFTWQLLTAPNGVESLTWTCYLGFPVVASLGLVMLATRSLKRPLEINGFLHCVIPTRKRNKPRHLGFPFPGRFLCSNPFLTRDFNANLRMRRPPFLVILFEIFLGLLVGALYLFIGYAALREPQWREPVWWVTTFLALIIALTSCAFLGSTAVARERETGTWDALKLALLPPSSLVVGKTLAPVCTCLLLSLPIWPLLLICFVGSLDQYGSGSTRQLLPFLGLLVSSCWAVSSYGIWHSVRQRKASTASGWTLFTLMGGWLIAPFLMALPLNSFFEETLKVLLPVLHPLVALLELHPSRSVGTSWGAWPCIAAMAILGLFFCTLSQRSVAQEWSVARKKRPED